MKNRLLRGIVGSVVPALAPALASFLVLVVLVGCATVGEIPVGLDGSEEIYISPANQDGIQDAVTLDLEVLPLERTRLTRYQINVVNLAGRPVRTIEEEAPRIPWFRRLRRNAAESVSPPEIIVWDGRDESGDFVSDGLYFLSVKAWDNRGNTGEAPVQRIVVDNTPPFARVSAPFMLFTPNGDGRIDQIPIYQRRASREDLWVGQISDRYGSVVREYQWSGTPLDFEWDGRTDAGVGAPEGVYNYLLSAVDRAGNSTAVLLEGIELELSPRSVAVSLDRLIFSPNDDGVADTVTITPHVESHVPVTSWSIKIVDINGDVHRTYGGTGSPAPIVFDGANDAGRVLPDGRYLATITVEYRAGQAPRSASPTFVLDNTPPRASVRATRRVFSPDGDGRNDTVEVLQSSTVEQKWTGILTNSAGDVIRRLTWTGEVTNFVWDGTGTDGEVLPDGEYTYTLTSVDAAGNPAEPAATVVRLDSRPTPVGLRASMSRFSPNGDGLHDIVTFRPAITVTDGIISWSLMLEGSSGEPLGIIAAGSSFVPDEIQWDGTLAGTPLPDGVYRTALEVFYEKGNLALARSTAVRLDTTPPVVTVTSTPARFSPDGDGINDILTIRISTRDESPIARWTAVLLDREGNVFMNWAGTGAPLNPIRWDGRSLTGELVQSAEDYQLVVRVTDVIENTGRGQHTIPVDILVIRDGDTLRIQIAGIYFVPNTPDYLNLSPELVSHNLATIDRLAQVLLRFPERTITIEGHAVSVFWYDPPRSARENQQVLVPLSRARADAIRGALIERGIPARRMNTIGYGGSRPVVPHGDLENRWKSRRVEFVLEQ